MDDKKYDVLKLDNQICFPLYACAKEVVKRYKPLLEDLELTYTQYITMMLLWEHQKMSVKELGAKLYLDSGTLTPVLKTLEKKGFINRNRDEKDERILIASVTLKGLELREKALEVPTKLGQCMQLNPDEIFQLYSLLNKLQQVL